MIFWSPRASEKKQKKKQKRRSTAPAPPAEPTDSPGLAAAAVCFTAQRTPGTNFGLGPFSPAGENRRNGETASSGPEWQNSTLHEEVSAGGLERVAGLLDEEDPDSCCSGWGGGIANRPQRRGANRAGNFGSEPETQPPRHSSPLSLVTNCCSHVAIAPSRIPSILIRATVDPSQAPEPGWKKMEGEIKLLWHRPGSFTKKITDSCAVSRAAEAANSFGCPHGI